MERRVVAEIVATELFLVLVCDRNLAWNKSASDFIRLIIEFKFLSIVLYATLAHVLFAYHRKLPDSSPLR
jgi:hypothetical protein